MIMHGRIYATGKRKEAVAKVWIKPGNGKIIINGQSLDKFLGGREALKLRVKYPLQLVQRDNSIDVEAKVKGGGIAAQADAVKHGIAKGLVELEPELRQILKPAGLLKRDARVVERKKYGKKKARRSPQFSKR